MATYHTPVFATTTFTGYGSADGVLPLISAWELPQWCSTKWYYESRSPGTVFSDSDHNPTWNDCQPYGDRSGIFSPGICPNGQELKQVVTVMNGLENGTTETLFEGHCCNTGFSWDKFLYSTESGGDTTKEYRYTCLSSFGSFTTFWSVIYSDVETTTVVSSAVTAIGKDMTIVWKESDLSLFPQTLAASLRIGMGLPPFSSASAPVSSTHIPSETGIPSGEIETAPKLSTGAIAGIGIGVATLALVLGVLGYLALARRWKTNQHSAEGSHPGIAEMETGENIYKHFSGGAWRSELHGSHSPNPSDGTQVDAHKPRAELHGNHSPNPGEGSHIDPRVGYYLGSTVVHPIAMELEGTIPKRQSPIPEIREDT